jgi:flagellar hook-associated protein 2
MPTVSYSGIASGIDSSALIESILSTRRRSSIDPLKNRITELTDTNAAFSQISSLLNNLNSAVGAFRTVNGGAVAKIGTSSDETTVIASASESANPGTFSITVGQLAKRATQSFSNTFATSDAVINSGIAGTEEERTVSFTVGNGGSAETVAIVVDGTTTAEQFVTEFNEQSNNAQAALINVGTSASPSYKIVVTSSKTGLAEGEIVTSVGTALTGFLTAAAVDQAEDAEFTVDGIAGTITRSSNTFSDLFTGVNLNLQDTGTATITVGTNQSEVVNRVQAFVDAYNELRAYIAENDAIIQEQDGSNVKNIFGPLTGTAIDENLLSSLRSAFSAASISGGGVNVLADLGITTQRDGSLSLDSDVLSQALSDEPDSVQNILANLGETLGAVDGTIAQFTRFNGILGQARSSNESQISSLNSRIANVEGQLSKQEEALMRQFARLEAITGKLQSQQQALAGLL